MVSVIFICAAICIGEMSSKVSFLFCSAPDGAFRVQTAAAAARACVRNLKPWVPTVPLEGDFGVPIILKTSKSICWCHLVLFEMFCTNGTLANTGVGCCSVRCWLLLDRVEC